MKQITPNEDITVDSLDSRSDFAGRHIGPGPEGVRAMLEALGLDSLEELVEKAVPSHLRSAAGLKLPAARTESAMLEEIRGIARDNQVLRSFIGMGYHGCVLPPVILRNVLENPGWYTAYTPYQAEISQGRLEACLNFQTLVSDLTGLEIANASLLDEGTAAAEAVTMCFNSVNRRKVERRVLWVSRRLHPQTLEVLSTRAGPLGIEVRTGDDEELASGDGLDEQVFAVVFQYPDTFGAIRDPEPLVRRAHDAGARAVVACDLLALTLLRPPGECGADVAVGSSQRFGVPLGFGGPHAAFFATREEYKRSIPGRMVGMSIDRHEHPALRLALQTREQHIRREKATSNICTAQVLLAVLAGLYGVWHGPEGLRRIARRTHRLTALLAEGLERLGRPPHHGAFFDTLAVPVPSSREVLERARAAGRNLRRIDDHTVGVALDETADQEDVEALWHAFAGRDPGIDPAAIADDVTDRLPPELARRSAFLEHPVFHRHRSETEMVRYLRRLREKDISLTRSMIPLGSCTMKLNAAAEMLPITWPEFSGLHPFAPLEQARGYLRIFEELSRDLAEITGFRAVSLQPNAGSQGEYAGLLVIRRWHASRGESHRDVCLIPSSAHGTNPASAVMAGLRVVVVPCDDRGNIDVGALEELATEHRERLAALMVTYPSTHGVFEESIGRVAEIVHENGGQVYLDGANLNALVGLCRPGDFGADVAHLNLHKTFCIPHGGGGPGVGPIGVREHLAPFLPRHSLVPEAGPETGIPAVASAPWGSAGILPISWAYLRLMGPDGLRRATETSILNANYIAARLTPHYGILYRGPHGMVAHECIVDVRPFRKSAGVDVADIAKRLIDFGFHAPTMSWPVPGTLMIEPTESESREELDRFCDAMVAIREEIRDIEEGRLDREDNPLKNAPHTAAEAAADEWPHAYSRERAVFPLPWVREDKYWPPVARVNDVQGDRHLVCTCPPPEVWAG